MHMVEIVGTQMPCAQLLPFQLMLVLRQHDSGSKRKGMFAFVLMTEYSSRTPTVLNSLSIVSE